jgi:peptidylprolyl isomerase
MYGSRGTYFRMHAGPFLCVAAICTMLVLGCGCVGNDATAPPAAEGDTVRVNYTGMFDNGTVFDSSAGGEPLEFTLGAGQVIPGFDAGVTGMSVGEVKTIHIPAADAYGVHDPGLVLVIGRGQLPEGLDPPVGQQMMMPGANGGLIPVTVIAANESGITVDANHPLAGKDLNFEVELVEIL